MKKFTSLFALLLGLSVFNAQADVTIYVYASNPSQQHFFWWGAEGSVNFDNSYTFDQVDPNPSTYTIGNITFYKKVLKITDSNDFGIIFWEWQDNEKKQTNDIDETILKDNETYYFYYLGGTSYLTPSSIDLKIAGPFTNWQNNPQSFSFDKFSEWTYELTPTETENVEFKLISTGGNPDWLGYNETNLNNCGYITLNVPFDWLSNSGGNFQLNHPSTGYNKYKLTAAWKPDSNKSWGWTFKIEGVGSLNLDLTDNISFLGDGVATSAATAKYTRTNIGGTKAWGTVCLPFAIDASNYTNVTFYDLTSVSDDALTFTKVNSVAAGHPTVFKLAEGQNQLVISEQNASVSNTISSYGASGWTVNGSFKAENLSDAFVIQNNEVHPSGTNLPIKAYRAWFTSNTTSPAPFRIEVDDTEDIQFVEQEDGTVKAYFDLQGRKLDGARKGLVIENGKIIMVK